MINKATTVPTQIRIDATVKEQANALFYNLGIDMSSAINIFTPGGWVLCFHHSFTVSI